jgi:hypothetical protein
LICSSFFLSFYKHVYAGIDRQVTIFITKFINASCPGLIQVGEIFKIKTERFKSFFRYGGLFLLKQYCLHNGPVFTQYGIDSSQHLICLAVPAVVIGIPAAIVTKAFIASAIDQFMAFTAGPVRHKNWVDE